MSARLREALVSQRGGRWTVDAKAASEAELIEALGVAHGCNYLPISVFEAREIKSRVMEVEVYDVDGDFVQDLYLLRRRARR